MNQIYKRTSKTKSIESWDTKHQWDNRGTKEEHTRKLYSVLSKLENEGYRANKKKIQILPKRNNMARTHKISRRHQTKQRKNRRIQQLETPHKHQNTKIRPWCHTIFRKIHSQPSRENRQNETITQERNKMGLDDGPKHGL